MEKESTKKIMQQTIKNQESLDDMFEKIRNEMNSKEVQESMSKSSITANQIEEQIKKTIEDFIKDYENWIKKHNPSEEKKLEFWKEKYKKADHIFTPKEIERMIIEYESEEFLKKVLNIIEEEKKQEMEKRQPEKEKRQKIIEEQQKKANKERYKKIIEDFQKKIKKCILYIIYREQIELTPEQTEELKEIEEQIKKIEKQLLKKTSIISLKERSKKENLLLQLSRTKQAKETQMKSANLNYVIKTALDEAIAIGKYLDEESKKEAFSILHKLTEILTNQLIKNSEYLPEQLKNNEKSEKEADSIISSYVLDNSYNLLKVFKAPTQQLKKFYGENKRILIALNIIDKAFDKIAGIDDIKQDENEIGKRQK